MNLSDLPPLAPLPLEQRLQLVERLWQQFEGDSGSPSPPPPRKPTPEEQMAAYEAHLKETDWGHQPC